MISGATRGSGRGDALPAHLLKSENEVTVIPARGLGSTTLHDQVRELVAQSAGGRTDRPIYHVFCSPDPGIADDAAVRERFWTLFESEFGMAGQPYCGVEHRKGGRLHEHRVYGVVRPSGAVVDLAWDYVRREKCGRIVEFEHGMEAVPSKHARSIARRLRQDGRPDVANWLVASGCTESVRPVARLTPCERATEERTDVALDDLRRATLSAWRETSDGPAFMAALRVRGLDLRRGRVGPVIMDATGTAHLATRVLGAASRRFEGERILAAVVRARLGNLQLEEMTDGRRGHRAAPGDAGTPAPCDPGGPRTAGAGRVGFRRFGGDPFGPDGGGIGRDGRGPGPAMGRLRAITPARGLVLRRGLNRLDPMLTRYGAATARARHATDRIDADAARDQRRAWALWGLTDIWGIPLR
ncbi:relaxase/mobilization nuclease domain-containing protein [Methylobacterium gossipiicola]|uniref:MobA/VirD2-like nuclease domain-containing protein n=1 Tax=Methylobacterium gossipiicola TaxID=582675 RepID=A0A1I2T1D8_9HYPH|nr:hypothetical protein [Methylobacterium gossipiicola]SFG57969.1 hypothetical protein SAMN05192565_10611 [Methylobacterium gossipiicola]